MKNIHVIPTDKPSRVFYYNSHLGLARYIVKKNDGVNTQHIYITSDEEIKEGDWYWLEKIGKRGSESGAYKSAGLKASKLNTLASNCKKVILTTDQDLVKDGVQAIDNDFLEWFVKNPSCEWVEVVDDTLTVGEMYKLPLGVRNHKYKIIIPKEEQKQNLIDMMQDDEKLGLYDKPKQTAVEWLIQELRGTDDKGDFIFQGVINSELIEQAKEMEKHQIIEAHGNQTKKSAGVTNYLYTLTGEKYYNETFKK